MATVTETDIYLSHKYPYWQRVMGVKKNQHSVYRALRTISVGFDELTYSATVFWCNKPEPGWYWRIDDKSGRTIKKAQRRSSHFDAMAAVEEADMELIHICSSVKSAYGI